MDVEAELDDCVRRIIAIHFHPQTGAPYWLARQKILGINAIEEIQTIADLDRFGAMEADALCTRPVLDLVPLSERQRLCGAVITDTGGTTGRPKRTIFSRDEFHAAFVEPFVLMAEHVGFPRDAAWLFVGPSGPHVIGQAATACAAALGSHQPFTVDFDPRWFRKLPHESAGRSRYIQHLLDQVTDVLRSEAVEVLFTTPVILERLNAIMSHVQRERIRGIHYGGMRVDADILHRAQSEWFPNAVHLAGYGNSLFGVCMEAGGAAHRKLQYFPHGLRHQVRVANDGRVWMNRLDPTVLIVNMIERDSGTAAAPPAQLERMGFGAGVEDPSPFQQTGTTESAGIY